MSNSPPFSDSPRGSAAFYLVQPNESPLQPTQVPESGNSSEPASFDELSALPRNVVPPSPYRSLRNEGSIISTSASAPSLRGLLATRPFPASPEGYDVRPTAEGLTSQNSSHQRISFERGRASTPASNHSPRTHVQVHPLLREAVSQTTRGIDSAMSRMGRSSDPTRPPSVLRSAGAVDSPKRPGHESPPAASVPHSRTASPLRRFGLSAFHYSQEDAFVPIDPFRLRTRFRRLSFHSPDIENHLPFDPTCEENPFCCITPLRCTSKDRFLSFLRDSRYFIMDTLPRQTYLHLLLRLPSLYFSRIARVYEDAQLSKPDLERMIGTYSSSRQLQQRQRIVRSSPIPPGAHHRAPVLPFPDEWTTANSSPALVRFKQSWEAFIDSLLREWKTLNLVSVLLHSAIISMFQNQVMANDPVIRTAALLSLTSALMSLSYGCIYIVRFGTMRNMYKATRWAEEAARTTTFILWNVWVLLAMPAVWLAWSMIFFVVAILAFIWRYGSSADPVSPQLLSPTAAIGPRIAVSALFFLGFIYLAAIVKTLHNYGRATEHKLSSRTAVGSGMPNIPEDDTRREEQGSRRGGRDGDYDHDPTRASRGPEHSGGGPERDATEPGGLSAVMGLGLTGLDEFASTHGLDEVPREKQQHRTEANI
ncbi:hypothetical protein J3R82DRAFT_3797 [Butyriboletus roseoflavus]|nr:hypothetical protein J3R82DRAFT_3797 [Butyriboletus roseoflavus]